MEEKRFAGRTLEELERDGEHYAYAFVADLIVYLIEWLREFPKPTQASRRQLRVSLLAEEFREYLEAELANDLVGIADGLADMEFVIHGTAHEYGIPQDASFNEVHRSNMSKVGEDGKAVVSESGKILKGPQFSPPDIAGILKRAGASL